MKSSDMLEQWPTYPKKVDLGFGVDESLAKSCLWARYAALWPRKLDKIE